jgi:hypothetical protein
VATLHVALDESGDLSFNPSGSKYYVFAVTWTYDPAPVPKALTRLRFSLLKQGHDIQAFHAHEDQYTTRDSVIEALTSHDNWWFAAIVVEKAKVNPIIRDPHRFYPKFASMVLRFVFKGGRRPGTKTVLIFTDALPMKWRRESVEKAIKKACRADLPSTVRFESYHHSRASNAWIQVADYCSWTVYRKWQHDDPHFYDRLKYRLPRTELDVLARGDTFYY